MALITKAAAAAAVSSRSSSGITLISWRLAYFAAGFLLACLWNHHESDMTAMMRSSSMLLPENNVVVVSDQQPMMTTTTNTNNRIMATLSSSSETTSNDKISFNVDLQPQQVATTITTTTTAQQQQNEQQQQQQQQRDFLQIAHHFGTDKVRGYKSLPDCVQDINKCQRPEAINLGCKVTGHFYNIMYQKWLGPLSLSTTEPFQFLEIGYFNGNGFDAYTSFLSNAAVEMHSMEISCIESGPRSEGKWPWDNFAIKNKHYQELLDTNRLHCGDASRYDFLHQIWSTQMKRIDAPPLKIVIDDGSHLSLHMVTSVFFWFPKLAPGGLLFIEDIEPQTPANAFRQHFLSQLMMDLHYCGLPEENNKTKLCFPTIQPLLKSISCEMHICVFERNDQPAIEYNETMSMPPINALNSAMCQG